MTTATRRTTPKRWPSGSICPTARPSRPSARAPRSLGSLTANGCPILVSSGGQFLCFLDTAEYRPTTYTYTDPYGRVFTMGADGALKAITDLNGSTLSFSADGIVSSVYDARGHAIQTIFADGATSSQTTAFGELRAQQGTTVNPYQYTGQHFDALTGPFALRARFYDKE